MSTKMIDLSTIARGAVNEQFEYALNEVLENISDPNTNPASARTITIKLTFKPDMKRESAMVQCNVTNSLAPALPASTSIYIEKVGASIVATEAIGYEQGDLLANR